MPNCLRSPLFWRKASDTTTILDEIFAPANNGKLLLNHRFHEFFPLKTLEGEFRLTAMIFVFSPVHDIDVLPPLFITLFGMG